MVLLKNERILVTEGKRAPQNVDSISMVGTMTYRRKLHHLLLPKVQVCHPDKEVRKTQLIRS